VKYPIPTGRAAQLLGVIEPQLSETVRRGKVRPAPWIVAGRRLWFAEHLIQAAKALGVLTPDLRAAIERTAPLGGKALKRFAEDLDDCHDDQEVTSAS